MSAAGGSLEITGSSATRTPWAVRNWASQLEPGLGPGWVLVHGEETHGLVPRHPEKGERLKRAGDLPAAAVGDQHTLARSRLAGDDHHWARALAEHLVTGGIGVVLRLELEVGLPAEHDHVASDCLGDDLLMRRSDILHHRAAHARGVASPLEVSEQLEDPPVRVGQPDLVAMALEGRAPERDRLGPRDGRLVEDPEPNQLGSEAAGPLEREVSGAQTMGRAVHGDERAADQALPRCVRVELGPLLFLQLECHGRVSREVSAPRRRAPGSGVAR